MWSYLWLDVSSLALLQGLCNPDHRLLSSCYLRLDGLADLRGYKSACTGLLGRLISNVLASEAVWELSPPDPVAPRVLHQTLGLQLSRGQASSASRAGGHSVLAHTVQVTGVGAPERLMALRTVLRLVADDDFLAVSACPIQGTYPSTS